MKSEDFGYKEFMAIMKEVALMSKQTEKDLQETRKGLQETKKILEEVAEQSKENAKRSKEADKRMSELQKLFTSQWGKLIEAIIEPACLNLFIERGIDVSDTQKNRIIKIKGIKKAEYDVILANGKEVVIVEVKTTLRLENVKYFIQKLSEVKTWIKSYADKDIYGAVAAISFDEGSDNYAMKRGLFVIKNSGEGIVSISNDMNFKPKAF